MEKIKELLLSNDTANQQLGILLAFAEYGKSFETFLEVIKNAIKPNVHLDILRLNLTGDLSIIIHKGLYSLLIFITPDMRNIFDISDFIKLKDISKAHDYFQYQLDDETDIFNNDTVIIYFKRLYHFLTYFDLL